MIADDVGHRLGFALNERILSPHRPLQVWEFADHERDQVGFRQVRASACIVDGGCLESEQLAQLSREVFDALGLRQHVAELVLKDDAREPLAACRQRDLAVFVVEEASIGESRPHHAVVSLPAVVRMFGGVHDRQVARKQTLALPAHSEVALVATHHLEDHRLGQRQVGELERSADDVRFFDQAQVFGHQEIVLDEPAARLARRGQELAS